MPELPEVETSRRGLAPLVEGRRILAIDVRQPRLRWPVPERIMQLSGATVMALERRAKWLIWRLDSGSLLWHLGMSGSFRAWHPAPSPGRHDHIDVRLDDGRLIRYTDPRRFGALLWGGAEPLAHQRLARLGPEPLGDEFDGRWLWQQSRGRRIAVKTFIMTASVVVGVGNIYACEALHAAGIDPRRAAGRISLARYQRLAGCIRETLADAITLGGTSLKDFTAGDGRPGYFGQALHVYGREGKPCTACGSTIRREIIAQRSTFFCSRCQH